jgi:hypothetical protein
MTKKELIEFLKDYPDNTKIQYDTGHGQIYDTTIVDWFDFSSKKTVLISGGYGDD